MEFMGEISYVIGCIRAIGYSEGTKKLSSVT